jgi:hypothetical protein
MKSLLAKMTELSIEKGKISDDTRVYLNEELTRGRRKVKPKISVSNSNIEPPKTPDSLDSSPKLVCGIPSDDFRKNRFFNVKVGNNQTVRVFRYPSMELKLDEDGMLTPESLKKAEIKIKSKY